MESGEKYVILEPNLKYKDVDYSIQQRTAKKVYTVKKSTSTVKKSTSIATKKIQNSSKKATPKTVKEKTSNSSKGKLCSAGNQLRWKCGTDALIEKLNREGWKPITMKPSSIKNERH